MFSVHPLYLLSWQNQLCLEVESKIHKIDSTLQISWFVDLTLATNIKIYLIGNSLWGCLSTLTLSILTLSRMTLSKVSFSDFLRNDYLDHFDTFGENFDFDTFKNDTFESVWVDRHPLYVSRTTI